MKKLLTILSLITFVLFLTSCGSDEPSDQELEEVVETFIDDSNAEETAADTSSTGVYQEEAGDEESSLQEAMAGNKEPEVEEGGMSFCDCVKENKRLSDIMMETEDDALFDKAMADMEAMKTGDCKILFAANQNTIDEKRAHERKVKRCLSK